jgi:hypothetical protein
MKKKKEKKKLTASLRVRDFLLCSLACNLLWASACGGKEDVWFIIFSLSLPGTSPPNHPLGSLCLLQVEGGKAEEAGIKKGLIFINTDTVI